MPDPHVNELRIGGLVRLSSVDWPGELAATVFLQGCPWRCPYCHNQHLLPAEGDGALTWLELRDFLASRRGLLDGVVFSGGEPLAQTAVVAAVSETRDLGLKAALHTGGVLPGRFGELLPMLSWVGFDVKAPFGDYERITRSAGSGERALESLRALVASGVGFEARTTVHPDLLSEADVRQMANDLAAEGVTHWVLQPFRTDGSPLDAPLNTLPLEQIAADACRVIDRVEIR